MVSVDLDGDLLNKTRREYLMDKKARRSLPLDDKFKIKFSFGTSYSNQVFSYRTIFPMMSTPHGYTIPKLRKCNLMDRLVDGTSFEH